jgi:23S rRNA pseudouridine1911/1915/1917 synthase
MDCFVVPPRNDGLVAFLSNLSSFGRIYQSLQLFDHLLNFILSSLFFSILSLIRYQDAYCYYVWKPQGVPTTFGEGKSLVEMLIQDPTSEPGRHLLSHFGKEEEYGLLNRLDTPTGGLVIFAKDRDSFRQLQTVQKQDRIRKTYVADLVGKVKAQFGEWKRSLKHHPDDPSRMTVCESSDLKAQICESRYEFISYNAEKDISTVQITITKGARHQIRVHCAHARHPIV